MAVVIEKGLSPATQALYDQVVGFDRQTAEGLRRDFQSGSLTEADLQNQLTTLHEIFQRKYGVPAPAPRPGLSVFRMPDLSGITGPQVNGGHLESFELLLASYIDPIGDLGTFERGSLIGPFQRFGEETHRG